MTIVKNTQAIRYHPLLAIDHEVGNLILKAAEAVRQSLKLKRFVIKPQLMVLEAYCDLTGRRITMETLRSPAIEDILQGFTKAMAGDALVALSEKESIKYCRVLYQVLSAARFEHPDLHQLTWDFTEFKQDSSVCAEISATATEFQQWYWKGWDIQRPRSATVYLRLAQLIGPYGRDFVQAVHSELEQYFRNRTGSFRTEWNYMFDYLAEHHSSWPLSTLKTEAGVKGFMEEFTRSYFQGAKEANRDAQSQIKNWNRFVNSVEECLCKPTVWASLRFPIQRPPLPLSMAHKPRSKKAKRAY